MHHILTRCNVTWIVSRSFAHPCMWLCQMVYAKVILGIQINWSTIPHTISSLRATRQNKVDLVPCLAKTLTNWSHWQNTKDSPTFKIHFDFFSILGHNPLEITPSNRVALNNANIVLEFLFDAFDWEKTCFEVVECNCAHLWVLRSFENKRTLFEGGWCKLSTYEGIEVIWVGKNVIWGC